MCPYARLVSGHEFTRAEQPTGCVQYLKKHLGFSPCCRFPLLNVGLHSFFRISILSLLITLVLPFLLAAAPHPDSKAHKEALRGYLVDLVCVKEEAGKLPDLGPNHTRKCLLMPACVRGGYAILLSSNEVLAFDGHGNDLALKFIASRHQEKGFAIKATGIRDGDHFHVLRIE